jgi:hypothetical protein
MSNDTEDFPKVVAAAIRGEDGILYHLPAPARHEDVRGFMMHIHGQRHPNPRDEGFLCDDGYWYCRSDAKLFATYHNQLIKKPDGYPDLLSTDVW